MKTPITFFWTILLVLITGSLSIQAQGVLHQVSISNGNEDADESNGIVEIYDLELDMGWNNGVKSRTALFFRDMYLETGAQVSSITLQLTTQTSFQDTIHLSIKVEDNPFPAKLQDSLPLVAERNFVSDSILWEVLPGEKNSKRQSPELLSLLQPVLGSANWESSSGLYLVIGPAGSAPDSGSSEYQCYSYDQLDSTKRPTLRVFVDSNDINGIPGDQKNQEIRSFPNPAKDRLTVVAETSGPWSLINLQGQRVRTGMMQSNVHTTIDVTDLPAGMYVWRDERSEASLKVIIQ